MNTKQLVEQIKNKDRTALAKAITLVESRKEEHRKLAHQLMGDIYPLTGKAQRIAISGTPGVGKSTFLEYFGMHLLAQGKKIAVLAVDPSSQKTGGSILGDKTRMAQLSAHENAFVRPSPNGETLGGVAAKTREAMLLCDAFGFDIIFVETVGVGQSELSVSHLVDMFILLMQPGSGDDLQGIKRGILEVSDLVLVHKADGDQKKIAAIAEHDFRKSLEILQSKSNWRAPVQTCSSLERIGFEKIQMTIDDFFSQYDLSSRENQLALWMEDLMLDFFKKKIKRIDWEPAMSRIKTGQSDPLKEVAEEIEKLKYD